MCVTGQSKSKRGAHLAKVLSAHLKVMINHFPQGGYDCKFVWPILHLQHITNLIACAYHAGNTFRSVTKSSNDGSFV